jgi:hypothetical protein
MRFSSITRMAPTLKKFAKQAFFAGGSSPAPMQPTALKDLVLTQAPCFTEAFPAAHNLNMSLAHRIPNDSGTHHYTNHRSEGKKDEDNDE